MSLRLLQLLNTIEKLKEQISKLEQLLRQGDDILSVLEVKIQRPRHSNLLNINRHRYASMLNLKYRKPESPKRSRQAARSERD